MTGKLVQRLQDPSRSGVYRAPGDAEVVDALRGGTPALHRISLAGAKTKKAVLSRIADAMKFPAWFGANWDALEDGLKDLSWSDADGHVLLFSAPPPPAEAEVLLEVLSAAAAFWKGEGTPFFAVFADPQASLALPLLFRPA